MKTNKLGDSKGDYHIAGVLGETRGSPKQYQIFKMIMQRKHAGGYSQESIKF